jgi:probable F420-dependent oxidoreductase
MHIGILPRYLAPNLTDARWLRAWAEAVEEAGVESIWCAEHVAVPATVVSPYPYTQDGTIHFTPEVPFPSALETLSFVAAVTSRVRLGVAVTVLAEHHPVEFAQRCATLDSLSSGRFLLGVGLGWMREEYEAMGVPFERRGERTDEYLAALRALWRDQVATFAGKFVSFAPLTVTPRPTRPEGPPIVIGGSSEAAARRAGRLGDGYYPAAIAPADLKERLGQMRQAAEAVGRDPDAIEVTTRPAGLSRRGSFDAELVAAYRDLGVARVVIGADEAEGNAPADSVAMIERFRRDILKEASLP